ncbi:MAG: ATP-binding protein [Pseudomonadota bacterium]|nr:ATP-binding protein [Pseudomonadota bacterium]
MALESIQDLRQEMLFLERAHASAQMGHFVLDPAQDTIEFSSWVCNNIGLPQAPIPLERLPDIIPETEREEFRKIVADIVANEDEFGFETNVVTAKGFVRTQRVSGIPAFEDEEKREGLIGFYGILQEVTSQKEAEAALIEARDNAQTQLVARTNILATVSHEIRTPLGGILGILDQLKREKSATERDRALTLIEDSCQVLLDTLDVILQQARLAQDNDKIEQKQFRPSALALRVAELFRPLARRKALRLEVHASSEIEAIGDPARIQQVLANFVSNAVKFTQSGIITIYVQAPRPPDEKWAFVISDTGSGMDEKRQKSIFEPFGESKSDSFGKSNGAGLGLSITRELVETMGGMIEVESELGIGTSFTVFLPLAHVEDEDDKASQPNSRGKAIIALERASDLVQAEAVLSELGFDVVDTSSSSLTNSAMDALSVIVADEAKKDSIPLQLLMSADQIILVGEGHEGGFEVPSLIQKCATTPSTNISRSLVELLERRHNDAA